MRKYISISPFYMVLILYLVANVYAGVNSLNNGWISLDGRIFELDSYSIFNSLLIQVGFLILFSIFYIFVRFGVSGSGLVLGGRAAFFLFVIQLSYLYFSITTGYYIAGSDLKPEGFSFIYVLFILAQPDLLYVIIGVLLASNKHFWINSVLFLLSLILRGWMAGFLVVFILALCRYNRISLRQLMVSIVISIIVFLMLPFIVEYKWVVRGGGDIQQAIENVTDSGYADSLYSSTLYIADRFQHLGHVALIFNNNDQIYQEYQDGKIMSFWLDGMLQTIYMKLVGYDPPWRLNNYFVGTFYGQESESGSWNTHIGISGWLLVLKDDFGLLFLYLIFMVFIPVIFLARFGGFKLFMVVWCFSIIYLFHGWVGIYFNLIFYSVVIVFLSRLRFVNN